METDNKTGRKIITISLHQDDIDLLNQVAGEVGVNRSELIRRMVYKFSFDDKGKAILRAGRITSHNVHYDNKENATAEPRSSGGPSSLEPTENIPQNIETHNGQVTMQDLRSCMGIPAGWKYNMQETIKIAKTRWVDLDEENEYEPDPAMKIQKEFNDLFQAHMKIDTIKEHPEVFRERIEQELLKMFYNFTDKTKMNCTFDYYRFNWRELNKLIPDHQELR